MLQELIFLRVFWLRYVAFISFSSSLSAEPLLSMNPSVKEIFEDRVCVCVYVCETLRESVVSLSVCRRAESCLISSIAGNMLTAMFLCLSLPLPSLSSHPLPRPSLTFYLTHPLASCSHPSERHTVSTLFHLCMQIIYCTYLQRRYWSRPCFNQQQYFISFHIVSFPFLHREVYTSSTLAFLCSY